MGNKFTYDERVEEVAERMVKAEPPGYRSTDHYFRNVLQRIGAGHCGYYPTFQDLNLIRAAQSITIRRMF